MATGRIGVTPTLGTRWSKAPAGGTTSLSGLDDNSVALVYSVGYEQVYRNGVLLSRGNDYTATTGNSITLIDATIAGDIIEVFANELVPLTDAISKGQFTAKGALLSATAASTPGVLTVGSNDQVLTADSSTSTGLKWATPSAGSNPNLTAEDATYYIKPSKYATVTASSLNLDAGVLFYIPIFLPANTYDRIGLYTHSTHTGTSVFRLGLYSVNATTGKPSAVVFDAGTVSATAASTVYEITISQNLSAGYYYLALNLVSKTGNAFLGYLGGGSQNTASSLFNSVLGAQTSTNTSLYENGVTGALPSPTPAGYTSEVFHTVGMRMS